MAAVRVLRVLEYTYPDAETAIHDRKHWSIQGVYVVRKGQTIQSSVMQPEVIEDEIVDADVVDEVMRDVSPGA